MANYKNLNNFYNGSVKEKEKGKGRRPPEIVRETRDVKGTKDGKSVEINNFKALRLVVDGQTFTEPDFGKLFPSKYQAFNIKHTWSHKMLKNGVEAENAIYFYFPTTMLDEHSIQVICRKKMTELTYQLS